MSLLWPNTIKQSNVDVTSLKQMSPMHQTTSLYSPRAVFNDGKPIFTLLLLYVPFLTFAHENVVSSPEQMFGVVMKVILRDSLWCLRDSVHANATLWNLHTAIHRHLGHSITTVTLSH